MSNTVLVECESCGGSGVYYNPALDPQGIGNLCVNCNGRGSLEQKEAKPNSTVFSGRRIRDDIEFVDILEAMGYTVDFKWGDLLGKTIPCEEFLGVEIPPRDTFPYLTKWVKF